MKKGKTNGAKALIDALERQGVDTIFGYPGGSNLPIYDELAKSNIRHVLARHEQGAAHMADGYARNSGKVGVCLATSGPGATNLVTGIATAYMDSSPIVAITGQVPRFMIGNDAFQEVDMSGITIPITKHNYLIQRAEQIPQCIEEAFYLASTGRRGPVVIDIPKDVQAETFSLEQMKSISLEGYKPTTKGHTGQIKRAVSLIKKARKPVIIAGGGIFLSRAESDLLEFAQRCRIPVVYTLMGKSVFPNSHELCLGLVGYHGKVVSNHAIMNSDLIIAMGTRFGDRSTGPLTGYAKQSTIIHIDIDPAEISKNVEAHIPVVGDAKNIITQLLNNVEPMEHTEWLDSLREVDEKHPLKSSDAGVTIPNILATLKQIVPEPIMVTDVGKHQIFAAHYFPIDRPRSFITSGGLGTMGFGAPAAIGVKASKPNKPVVAFVGDGSFLMTAQEIASAVEENLPVLVLIMNDYCLGMVKQLQDVSYGKRNRSCGLGRNVDYAKLSESMGGTGFRVTKEEELKPAIEKGLASDRICVVDCILEETPHVFPMVTGKSLLEYVE
jgi:acetolactate synthase-1/2/3 large subunit